MSVIKKVKVVFDPSETEIILKGSIEIEGVDSDTINSSLDFDVKVRKDQYDNSGIEIVDSNYDFDNAYSEDLAGIDSDKVIEAMEEPIKNYARELFTKLGV